MRLLLLTLTLALGLLPLAAQAQNDAPTAEEPSHAARPTFPVPLTRGSFDVYDLPPAGTGKALIVFLSGGSGWTYWEDRVARHLARRGFYMVGVDTERYAADPFTQETLASDLERIAAAVPPALLAAEAPVFYGGYGAGAALAAAAAALPPAPPRLAGLLLAGLADRGRYGVHFSDLLAFTIRGGGTFRLADLGPQLGPLRVAQLHVPHGWFDSTAWLATVPGPRRQFDYPQSWRQFRHANAAFLKALDAGTDWLLPPPVSPDTP